ncbi:uncharacterized protein PV09_09683 [Verruconis gallopava]|uniref:3-oxoacyl-[acyl-carrier-protein] reductase n=1 Tax=Verruconis gallopava TaxID=253628 RepID=A0A0D1YCY3_9PEZI|nr:uncharacterized protein PV09_09683 [Verruconis gallopava]KIV98506.1 hypothetical protein PV09_09683 [Verruconis gallopava]
MAPNFDLRDRVVVITGGSGGIGFATAQLLLSQGAKVSIADVSDAALRKAVAMLEGEQHPGQLYSQVVDVRKPDEVNDWIKKTVKKFGKLDGACNLAGVIPKGINKDTIETMPDDEWHFVIDVNLHGVMHCMRAQIQNMNNEGSIVNASSIAGIMGFPKNAAYTASKHAVIGLSRSAAKEVGDRFIRVNCISPGIIDTPMHQASNKSRGGDPSQLRWQIARKGKAEEVAALINWLLSPYSKYITGSIQTIDGGWTS